MPADGIDFVLPPTIIRPLLWAVSSEATTSAAVASTPLLLVTPPSPFIVVATASCWVLSAAWGGEDDDNRTRHWWRTRLALVLKHLPHSEHMNFRSPVCRRSWVFMLASWTKRDERSKSTLTKKRHDCLIKKIPIITNKPFFVSLIQEIAMSKCSDPDPNWSKFKDPDPNKIYLDPQHCFFTKNRIGTDIH